MQTVNIIDGGGGSLRIVAAGPVTFDITRLKERCKADQDGDGNLFGTIRTFGVFGEEEGVTALIIGISFDGVPCADRNDFEANVKTHFIEEVIL
jgi:hypothetical protein